MVKSILRKQWLFIVVVMVSIALLGFGHSNVAPIAEDVEKFQNEAVSRESDFVSRVVADQERLGMPANHALADQRARAARLEEAVAALARQVNYVIAPKHQIPEGLSELDRTQFASNSKRKVQSWLERYIPRRWGTRMTQDAMGYDFDRVDSSTRNPLEEKLRRVDLVERVASQAIDSGLEKVTAFRFLPAGELPESVRARVPATQLAGARRAPAGIGRAADPEQDQAAAKVGLLKGMVMEVEFKGTTTQIWEFLLGLQQSRVGRLEGRALALETLSLDKEDPMSDTSETIVGKATLIAYEVNLGAEMTEASMRAALERWFPERDMSDAPGGGAQPLRPRFGR